MADPFSFLFPPGSLAWKEQFDESGDLVEVALTPREQALLDHITCGGSPRTFVAFPPRKVSERNGFTVIDEIFPVSGGIK